jgi:hypothetical protein
MYTHSLQKYGLNSLRRCGYRYDLAVASQVCTMAKIVSKKTGQIDKSVITNLCIKALCKIGGVPWSITQTGEYAGVFSSGGLPCMVIGIDNSCNMKKVKAIFADLIMKKQS